MPSYAVDSKRQGLRATGIVNEVTEWVEDPATGRRRSTDVQSRDADSGMPLWAVEIFYKQTAFGREAHATTTVRVGSPVRPVVREFGPVEFVGLVVEVRTSKAGGVVEIWHAEGMTGQPAGSGEGKAA